MAMPLEGGSNVYDDTDILDEISDYLTNACFYNNALLEPTNDLLCARQPNVPVLPLATETWATADIDDNSVLSRTTPQWDCLSASPSPSTPQLYDNSMDVDASYNSTQGSGLLARYAVSPAQYNAAISSPLTEDAVKLHDSCTLNFSEIEMSEWINDTYATGHKVQASSPLQLDDDVWPHQHADISTLPFRHHALMESQSPSTLSEARTEDDASTSLTPLSCDYDGCNYSCAKRETLRHHQRCHIPMEDRPYSCPSCSQRFLYPREVRRHLSTHGLGLRHYCPFTGCRYAMNGFGRRDHLQRHLRKKHPAGSGRQNLDTSFKS